MQDQNGEPKYVLFVGGVRFEFLNRTDFVNFMDMLMAHSPNRYGLFENVVESGKATFLETVCTAGVGNSERMTGEVIAIYRAVKAVLDRYGSFYDPEGDHKFNAFDSDGKPLDL